MRRLFVVLFLALVLISPQTQKAFALPSNESAAIRACETASQGLPNQFDLVKRYPDSRLWPDILEHVLGTGLPLFCGHNLTPNLVRHGYLHIRDGHSTDWENVRGRMVTAGGPGAAAALPTWMDLVDGLIRSTILQRSELTTDKTECRSGILWAGPDSSTRYYQGYRLIVQRGGGVLPEDAVGTIYPSDKDCSNNPIVYPQAREQQTRDTPKRASGEVAATGLQVNLRCEVSACTFLINADNAVIKTAGSSSFLLAGPLKRKWESSRNNLTAPTTDTKCRLVSGGCYNHFGNSSIYFSEASGAQLIQGAIRSRWKALGWEKSFLKYPTTSEKCGLVRGGCYNTFQAGSIHYSPTTGAWPTRGSIRQAWRESGWENGPFGYPNSDESHPADRPSNHRTQHFEYGFLYWDGASVYGEWFEPGCPACTHRATFAR